MQHRPGMSRPDSRFLVWIGRMIEENGGRRGGGGKSALQLDLEW